MSGKRKEFYKRMTKTNFRTVVISVEKEGKKWKGRKEKWAGVFFCKILSWKKQN